MSSEVEKLLENIISICKCAKLQPFIKELANQALVLLRAKPEAGEHPEDFCDKCGRPNITWYADSDLWNEVTGKIGGGILCPICFVEMAEKKGHKPSAWRISKEGDAPEIQQLRVKNAALLDASNARIKELEQKPPAGEFTKEWRTRLKNVETLWKMGHPADDWLQDIVTGFRMNLDLLDASNEERDKLKNVLDDANGILIDLVFEEDSKGKNQCFECECKTSQLHDTECSVGTLLKKIKLELGFCSDEMNSEDFEQKLKELEKA